jgi:hypothetical protein
MLRLANSLKIRYLDYYFNFRHTVGHRVLGLGRTRLYFTNECTRESIKPLCDVNAFGYVFTTKFFIRLLFFKGD